MNKQEFKKAVKSVSLSISNEMQTIYYNVEGANKDKISIAIAKVLNAKGTALRNANHFFGQDSKEFTNMKEYRKAKGVFFKKLFAKIRTDFNNEISVALNLFNEAIPQDAKGSYKDNA